MREHDDSVNMLLRGLPRPAKKRSWLRRNWITVATILAIIILSAVIYLTGAVSGDVEAYGYLGVFIIAILAGSIIIVPVPGLPVVFLMGAILNPWLVGLMAGLGEPIGEIPAYMAGYGGRSSLEQNKRYARLNAWMQRRGTLVLFLVSAIPNVIFDLVGAAAGALRYPFWKYMLVVFIGKTIKGLVVAFAGYWSLRLILHLLLG